MDQDHTPPQPRTSSNPAAATLGPFAASSSASSPVRGPTSSAMLLGLSSPAHSPRRYSPSLYPPPLSSRLASGSGSSSGSPSRFRQEIPPSPKVARGGRQRSTHALPSTSTAFSKLESIRRVGAARATSQYRSEMRAVTLYGGRPLQQALPSWSAMYARSRLGTPPRSRRSFSGFAPPVSRQLQPPPSTGTLPPQPSRQFSFPGFAKSASQKAKPSSYGVPPTHGRIASGAFSSLAMQQQQAKSSFTDLAPRPGGSAILSGTFSSPEMHQQQTKSSFTDLLPLPGGSGIFPGSAPPASQQPEAMSSFSDLTATQAAFHGGQPLQQAWPSLPTMSRVGAPPPIGSFSGFAPSASQQLQPSSSGVPLLPGGTFSGFPSPAMPEPQANSSFTDQPPLPSGSGFFSDLPSGSGTAPAATQELQAKSSFTSLAPLPGGSFSGLTPWHSEAAMFGSSSWSSSDQLVAPASDTMYGQGQPASDSELPPLPPSLQIRSDEVMQFSQPSGNDSTFSEYEATRMHRPHVLQVKKEPVDIDTPCLLHQDLIQVDDDEEDDDEISALLRSFQSPNEPASLCLEPTSTADMLQLGGGGVNISGFSALGVVEGSGQSWKAMVTPYVNVTTSASIPWNFSDGSISMSQQQIPQQGDVFSTGLSDTAMHCQPSGSNIILSEFGQQLQPNLQMPMMLSAADLLQLISRPGPSIWSTADSSGQDAPGMPDASASMFDQMSIGGGTVNTGQGWPETAVAADQYGMFDNSGSSSSASAVPDEMASKFDQVSIGEGSLNIGQGWPGTPAPTFDITGGGSSSSAWASMPWNSSSWTMENYSTPGPNLGLVAMEQPRSTTPRPPSVAAGASPSMSQRGADDDGDCFSAAEIEMIIKDKRLKEMVNTDPRRVKKILNNRTNVAKLRPQRRAE